MAIKSTWMCSASGSFLLSFAAAEKNSSASAGFSFNMRAATITSASGLRRRRDNYSINFTLDGYTSVSLEGIVNLPADVVVVDPAASPYWASLQTPGAIVLLAGETREQAVERLKGWQAAWVSEQIAAAGSNYRLVPV